MFSIVMNQAIEDCVQLGQCSAQFTDLHIETESIIRELGSLSGMEEVLMRLRSEFDRMQGEQQVLRQMMQALDRTIMNYANYENRICDNAEQSMIRYTRREIGINDFSQISNLLGEVFSE
jgi:hypothetical protein